MFNKVAFFGEKNFNITKMHGTTIKITFINCKYLKLVWKQKSAMIACCFFSGSSNSEPCSLK
jgi:hypothetical protein